MAERIYPGVEDLLTLIMQELPAGVYPDDRADSIDPDARSNSSSELRAHALIYADLYGNLEEIAADKFISTITPEGLAPWELMLFSAVQDAGQGFDTRKNNLLAKRRALGSISLPSIRSLVAGILDPLGIPFDILPYSGQNNGTVTGAWILSVSPLGLSSWLALLDPIRGAGGDSGLVPLDCDLDYAAAGITAQQLADIQATAYTYELQIYGNADATTLALLDRLLTQREPARSTHVITNNATPPDTPPDAGTELWNTNYLWWWQ